MMPGRSRRVIVAGCVTTLVSWTLDLLYVIAYHKVVPLWVFLTVLLVAYVGATAALW